MLSSLTKLWCPSHSNIVSLHPVSEKQAFVVIVGAFMEARSLRCLPSTCVMFIGQICDWLHALSRPICRTVPLCTCPRPSSSGFNPERNHHAPSNQEVARRSGAPSKLHCWSRASGLRTSRFKVTSERIMIGWGEAPEDSTAYNFFSNRGLRPCLRFVVDFGQAPRNRWNGKENRHSAVTWPSRW